MDCLVTSEKPNYTKANPEAAYGRSPEFGEGFSAKVHTESGKAGQQPPLLKLGVAIFIKAEPPYVAY